jgi:hypothetical protein
MRQKKKKKKKKFGLNLKKLFNNFFFLGWFNKQALFEKDTPSASASFLFLF